MAALSRPVVRYCLGAPRRCVSARLARLSGCLFAGGLLLTSCATTPTEAPRPPFTEEDQADVIIRYYSDDVSRILKPKQTEGEFLSTFDVKSALEVARKQPGRELAVVVLIFFNTSDDVKIKWCDLLKNIGYHRIVFLRGDKGLHVNGLSILENPPSTTASAARQPRS